MKKQDGLQLRNNRPPTKIEISSAVTQVKLNDKNKAERSFKVEYDRIVSQARELVELSVNNETVYNSEFNFEPLVGETYHLYIRKNGIKFLSLIGPKEWSDYEYLGSFLLDEKRIWNRVNIEDEMVPTRSF